MAVLRKSLESSDSYYPIRKQHEHSRMLRKLPRGNFDDRTHGGILVLAFLTEIGNGEMVDKCIS